MTMAHASSAQREPSMEEILASIRRIIEDSDTVRKPGRRERAPLGAKAETYEAPPGIADADPFRTEFEPANSDRAELRVTSVPQDDDVTPDDEGVEAASAETESESLLAGETDAFDLPENFADDMLAPAAASPAVEEEQVLATDAGLADASQETIGEPQLSPILSETTGRQVAAAFGELTDAFAATRRKSFDELAAEMLRPMLQDWLDNNLPTLVEKLVREEIERVARGGAR